MTIETADLLRSPVRRHIIELITDSSDEGMDAAAIADDTGLHVTTARFHLDQLENAGLISSTRRKGSGAGRPRKIYLPAETPSTLTVERDHRSLQMLSGLLTVLASHATDPNGALSPEEAGEQWAREHVTPSSASGPAKTPGEWLSKIGGLTDVLHEWGYTPAITTDGGAEAEIRLAHCPFRDLARANPAVVCGIHLGLIRGTMANLGERDTEVSVVPFAEGETCVAKLSKCESQPKES